MCVHALDVSTVDLTIKTKNPAKYEEFRATINGVSEDELKRII